jgi:hypothetical protein
VIAVRTALTPVFSLSLALPRSPPEGALKSFARPSRLDHLIT